MQQAEASAGGHGSMESLRAMEFFTVNKVHVDTVVYSFAIVVILIILGYLAGRRAAVIPKGIQALFEIIYTWLKGEADDMIGKDSIKYVPLVVYIFLFVLLSNWIGLIPTFITPTRDINTTVALALISFFSFIFAGISKSYERERKKNNGSFILCALSAFINWLGHYFHPAPDVWKDLEGVTRYTIGIFLFVLFLFLNIVEELARIVSLSVRLMGNIMGEHLAIGIFLSLVIMPGALDLVLGTTKVLAWSSSVFAITIGALTGFIQAMIFAVLTISYISTAVSDEH